MENARLSGEILERIEELEKRLQAMDVRMDSMKTQLSTGLLGVKMAMTKDMTANLIVMGNRIDAITASVNANMNGINAITASMNANMHTINASFISMNVKIGKLRKTWETMIIVGFACLVFYAFALRSPDNGNMVVEESTGAWSINERPSFDEYLNIKAANRVRERKVSFMKLKADYFLYLAKRTSGDEKYSAIEQAQKMYEKAFAFAKDEMQSRHPMRLELALKLSKFYHGILNEPKQAYQLAKQAFGDALAEMDTANEDSDERQTLTLFMMKRISHKLELWAPEKMHGTDDDDGETRTEL